jgi:benzodiazapine receptor
MSSPATARLRAWLPLGGFLVVVLIVAALGGVATANNVGTWYAGLNKPVWNPPAGIFGPVWTVLYALMAVVAFRLWRERDRVGARVTLHWWWAQLAANALWSPLFFGLRAPGWALLDILVLLALLLVIATRLWRIDRLAWILWLPYMVWVGFATVLNFTLWRLNCAGAAHMACG